MSGMVWRILSRTERMSAARRRIVSADVGMIAARRSAFATVSETVVTEQFAEFTTRPVDDLNALVRQLAHLEHVVRFRKSEKRPDRGAFSDFYSYSRHVRKLSRVRPERISYRRSHR